jgi:hypothetical protein
MLKAHFEGKRLLYQPYTCNYYFLANDIGGKQSRWSRSPWVGDEASKCAERLGGAAPAMSWWRMAPPLGARKTAAKLQVNPMMPVALPSALQGNFKLPVDGSCHFILFRAQACSAWCLLPLNCQNGMPAYGLVVWRRGYASYQADCNPGPHTWSFKLHVVDVAVSC